MVGVYEIYNIGQFNELLNNISPHLGNFMRQQKTDAIL